MFALNPLTPNIREQIRILSPHTSYRNTGKNLLKCQENSSWTIISLILMTLG